MTGMTGSGYDVTSMSSRISTATFYVIPTITLYVILTATFRVIPTTILYVIPTAGRNLKILSGVKGQHFRFLPAVGMTD